MLDLGSAQPVDSIHFSASVTTELFAARKPAAGVRRDGHILRAVDRAVADLRGHVVGLGSMTVEQMDLGVGALLQCNPLASAELAAVAALVAAKQGKAGESPASVTKESSRWVTTGRADLLR